MIAQENTSDTKLVLVTGVTGYVGGRLVPRLLEAGYRVRVLIRGSAERLTGRPWRNTVEVVVGDVLDPTACLLALQGADAAYYLIHSMGGHVQFAERDIAAARNFAQIAAACRLSQIIYLGGLGDPDTQLSEHLRSRQETGDALRSGGVPVTEFRAGMVVGSGSISFEMLRDLSERLPIMICPRWVSTRTQPIAIRDVLSYLLGSLVVPESRGQILEIGGADVLTYIEMMQGYARARRLRRLVIPVPVLSPRLSSRWVHLITPVPAEIAQPLIEGLRSELLVRNTTARTLFPDIHPLGFDTAVALALDRIRSGRVETIWSDALASSQGDLPPVTLIMEQGTFIERREREAAASPEVVFAIFTGLGGDRGWPSLNWLWGLRGAIDKFIGGVGMRRGRRHPDELRPGDALDFWRVEAVEPNQTVLLRAEMIMPGRGWLRFTVRPDANPDFSQLVQTAFFAPRGLIGLIYWYCLYPFHVVIFSRMIDNIARQAAEAVSGASRLPTSAP